MQRIRQWRKTGAALGLFALVLQLWLSFGHVHAEAGTSPQIEAAALSTPDDHDDTTLDQTVLSAGSPDASASPPRLPSGEWWPGDRRPRVQPL